MASQPDNQIRHLIVVEKRSDWRPEFPDYPIVTAREYLSNPEFAKRGVKVLNLCRAYGYLTTGYYCSLLGEARRHRMLPSVRTLSDLTRKALYRLDVEDLDTRLSKLLRKLEQDRLVLHLHFGKIAEEFSKLADIAEEIFEAFPSPILRVELRRDGIWRIHRIQALGLTQLKAEQRDDFIAAMNRFLSKPWRMHRNKDASRYDLAILYNPDDPLSPSDPKALQKFVKLGKPMGFSVDIISRGDFAKLAEYDALFIRETTRTNHYTYRFSRKAESEGMVVIDDPTSILKCTNKVYLAELLRSNRIPQPKTLILQEGMLDIVEPQLGFPVVLKIPDGSFSKGVYKAANFRELEEISARLFEESDLILAQEYLYTEYDWRVGVLNNEPLFVCQYFMSKNHWQIVDHKTGGGFSEGGFRTMAIEEAPAFIVETAVKAAKLIGNGLYGVDVKQNGKQCYVIEINDNPNLEAGVEDSYLKDELYRRILAEFARRIDQKRAG